MSTSGILYSSPFSFQGLKVMITAEFSGASIKHCSNVSSNQSAIESEVLSFEADKSEFFAFESNTIAYHVADESLRGLNDCERSKVKEFLTLAYTDLDSITSTMVQRKNFGNFEKVLKVLEERLTNYTYLAAERVTLADIAVFCSLLKLFFAQFDENARAQKYPCTNRWLQTILYHDNVSKMLKKTVQEPAIENFASLMTVKKMFETTSGKKAVAQGGKGKQQQSQQQSQQQQQSAKPAKGKGAEPKAAAPVAAAADDDEESAPVKEAPSPFAALPAGKFDMNAFKRSYSNDDEKTSIAYFWSHFDPQCYSIWFAEYKYADELTKVFMTCNLVSGMFQRLDKMRAQSFGSMLIFGSDNNNSISGVWIWRGQDLAFKLSPDWQVDYELYEWKKLNPASEKDKALVNQYLEWTGCDSKKRPFNQGKIFK